MKVSEVKEYQCETCGSKYRTEGAARLCESKPLTQDRGVQKGDKVRIIRGDGQGLATVEGRHVYDLEWGHYAWERYWHTVGLTAKCDEGFGHRQLTFDDYELVPVDTTVTKA